MSRIFFSIGLSIIFVFVVVTYGNWYFSLPVVKYDPSGEIVAIEIDGKYFDPDQIEIGDRYRKKWVSSEWEMP